MPADRRAVGDLATWRDEWDGTTNLVPANDESFRVIVNRIPAFICTLTATGQIEFVNDQVLEYFGRTLDELKHWPASDAVHPDDLATVIATLQTSIETGEPSDVELRLRRADGVYRWFLLRRLPHHDSDGHVVRWYTVHTDIDDRRRGEQLSRASEESLRLTLDSIGALVTTFSASGELDFANRPFQDYTGRPWRSSRLIAACCTRTTENAS